MDVSDSLGRLIPVLNQRGYLVVTVIGAPLRPGEVLHDVLYSNVPTEQPFAVLSETDLADYLSQFKMVNMGEPFIKPEMRFYRVTTD